MKRLILSIIFALTTMVINAQEKATVDTSRRFSGKSSSSALVDQINKLIDQSIKFDHKFYECENQWVIAPQKKGTDNYGVGFVYLDAQAGFTLEYEGEFKIDENNKYVRIDTGPKTVLYKVRLGERTVPFALLPKNKVKELGFDIVPDWLDIYLIRDSVAHDIAVGKNLNAIDVCLCSKEERGL